MPTQQRSGPVIAAAAFLGMGLGGFLDGIILLQILQRHQMISAWLPPDTLEAAKTNMFRDGMFHAGAWTLTAVGVVLLRRLAGRRDVLLSNALLAGGLIPGWGATSWTASSTVTSSISTTCGRRWPIPNGGTTGSSRWDFCRRWSAGSSRNGQEGPRRPPGETDCSGRPAARAGPPAGSQKSPGSRGNSPGPCQMRCGNNRHDPRRGSSFRAS